MLVLHPEVAAQKVLPSIPATVIHEPVLESDWALREREVVGEDGSTVRIKSIKERLLFKHATEEFFVPEAGDYHADYSATRPQVKGAVAMEGQEGRKDAEATTEAGHLFGKYQIDYTLVEPAVTAADFSKAAGRDDGERELDDDEKYEGQRLDLDPDRGHAYLATKKLVPDLEKQTSRPAEVAGQRQSDCSDDAAYEPNLDALSSHAHAPVADFGTMTGRPGSPDSDDESRRLGPGAYENIDPAVAHPSAPAAFFGTGREDDPHASGEPDHEGDMLVLHPEVAAQKVLPSIPATVIHEPVLESDWARRTRTVVAADGRTVQIASLWQHVVWKRLAELLARYAPMSVAAPPPPARGCPAPPRSRSAWIECVLSPTVFQLALGPTRTPTLRAALQVQPPGRIRRARGNRAPARLPGVRR